MTPDEIRAARQTLGLTLKQFARVLGYGDAMRAHEIENGKRNPGGAVMRLIRAYLDGYRPNDWPTP